MKKTFLLLAFGIFIAACSSRDHHEDKMSLLPSTEGNILHELYEELKEQRPELHSLEQEIRDIDQSKDGLLKDYKAYNAKNEQGYRIANEHAKLIKDSSLRNNIELLINKSQYNYDQDNAAMALEAARLENRSSSLHDHQEALKIILTLNLMEKYQKKQLPNSSAYEKIIHRYNTTIYKADSLLQAK
jgi:phosphoenolpyruvate-protein kinase (PTS system EI component)